MKKVSDNIQMYRERGYATFQSLLTKEVLYKLQNDILNTTNQLLSNGVGLSFVQEVNLWKKYTSVYNLIKNENILNVCKTLLQTKQIKLWQDQLIIKPAYCKKESVWHQDFPYWPMQKPTALTCWIPFAHVNKNNGCLKFLSGSHKFENELSQFPISIEDLKILSRYEDDFNNNLHYSCMEVGDCSFHHGMTFHGACANETSSARVAIKIVYMASDTIYKFLPHTLTRSLDLVEGDKINGPNFPLL